jgi:hypothetical protein
VREDKNRLSPQDMVTRIAELVNAEIRDSGSDVVLIDDVLPKLIGYGATQADFERTIDEYVELCVWQRLAGGRLKLVNPELDDE